MEDKFTHLNMIDLFKFSRVQYPNVNIVAKIGLAVYSPIAPLERMFSLLNRLETSLRTTMGYERDSMLAIIEFNQDFIPNLNEVMAE